MNEPVTREREVVLLDLLDRILDKGVILYGEVVISVAEVDLIYVGLKVLLTSVDKLEQIQEQRQHLPELKHKNDATIK